MCLNEPNEEEFVPEKRLLVAILVRAVRDAYYPKFSECFTFSTHSRDAKRWLTSNSERLFSYIWIKKALNIEHISDYKIISKILQCQIETNGRKAHNFSLEKVPECCNINNEKFDYKLYF